MKIRRVTVDDIPELNRIKDQVQERMEFRLDLPDFGVYVNNRLILNPEYATALVFIDDLDIPRMATVLRRTTESTLLMDRKDGVSHREWMSRFICMEKASYEHAKRMGITDSFTFLSPDISDTWGRVIERRGWKREDWPVWRRR